MLKKNTASQSLTFVLVNASTGAALTGATVTAKRCIDGAAQASVTGSVTELAGGQYLFAPSQADTNGDLIGYLFTATSAIPVNMHVRTTAADLSDAVRLGLTALPNAACTANASLVTSGTGTDQLSVASGRVDLGKILGTVSAGAVGYVQLDNAQPILSAPAANTVGEALYMADAMRGRFGTAQAGTAMTITLDASASAVDGRYVGYAVLLSGGTGGGLPGTAAQERTIVAYNGTSKVATVDQAWGTNPDATTVYKLKVHPKVDVYMWAGDNAGVAVDANHLPKVDVEDIKGTASAGTAGYVGPDWGHVNAPTTSLALTGTTIAVTQKVDVDTIKTNPVANAGTVTFPTGATLASTTNITAGTIATVTNLTNAPTAGDLTATMKTSVTTAATAATPVAASVTGAVGSVTAGVSLAASQHVIVDSGTVTTLTNLPAITTDWLTGTGVAASAVTKIQSGLSTYAGGDTSGTTTLLTRVTAAVALAGTALSTVQWTNTLATNLGTLAGHDPGATLGTSTLTQAQVTGGAYSVQSSSCVLGDARAAYLDASILGRMATYTQPSGFLAATFPAGVIANTTNITAGVITTATSLTNLPAVTTDWLSAAGLSTAAGAKIADIALRRTMTHVQASSDGDAVTKNSLYGSVQQMQHSSVSGTTLTVLNPDATTLGTFTVTVSAGADPLSGIQ